MAIRFLDSFSHYSTAQLLTKWTGVPEFSFGARSIVVGGGRCKQNCLQLVANTIGSGDGPSLHLPYAGLVSGTMSAGYQLVGDNFLSPGRIFVVYNNGTLYSFEVAALAIFSNGTIGHLRGSGGTEVVRSLKAIQDNSWHHIAWCFTLDPSAGRVIVYVDGDVANPWIDFTGNTGTAGYTDLSVLRYSTPTGGGTTQRMCDFFWGDSINDYKGDTRVYARLPNADGANLGWTPAIGTSHFAMVNDNPATDSTKYNSTLTIGATDTYKYPAIGIPSGTVYAVQVNPRMFKTDVGFRSAQPVIRQDGVNYTVGNADAIADGEYLFYPQCFETDPTSAAWDVNHTVNDEFGEVLVG